MADILIDIKAENARMKLASLSTSFKKTDNAIEDAQAELDRFNEEMLRTGEYSRTASGRLVDMNGKFAKTKIAVDKTDSSVGRLNKNILNLAGATAVVYGLKTAFDSVQVGFKSLENAGLAVQKTTGLAGDDLKALTDELDRMSTSMSGFEVKGLYDIAESAGQLGIKGVDNLKTFTKEMQYMASSSKLTAEESAIGFAEIANVLKLPISEINHLTASYTELASSTTASEQWLLDSMQRIAGAGHEIGISNSELVAISATMKDVGLNVEISGTAMSDVFAKMAKDTDSFAIVAGESFSDFDKMMRDEPIKALEEFLDGLGKLDTKTKFKVLDELKLSGMGTSQTLLKLSSNIEKLEKNILTSNEAYREGTATEDEYRISAQSLEQQQMKATSAIKLAQKALGDELKPTMIEVNKLMIIGATYIGEHSESLIDVAKYIGIATTAGLAFNIMMKATPWGIFLTGVATAIVQADKLADSFTEISLAMGLNDDLRETRRLISEQELKNADSELALAQRRSEIEYNSLSEKEKAQRAYNEQLKVQKGLQAGIEQIIGNDNFSDTAKQKVLTEMGNQLNESFTKTKKLKTEFVDLGKTISDMGTSTDKNSVANEVVKTDDVLKKLIEHGKDEREGLKENLSIREDSTLELLNFEDTYKKSTLSNFDYRVGLLNKEKKEYLSIKADAVKVDEWYNAEFKKLDDERLKDIKRVEDEKNEKLQESWDKENTRQVQLFEEYTRNQEEKQSLEITYQNLLGNYDYEEDLKYQETANELKKIGKDYTADQIKMLEKQREAQDDLNSAIKTGVQTIFDGIIAGDSFGNVLTDALDGFNQQIANSFSESISGSITDSVKEGSIVDFGIFDEKGNLSEIGINGAMTLGNLFTESAFGDNKNAERGAEFGQIAGFAMGGTAGAIGGQIGGAILGSMLGGSKSYYSEVSSSGTVEAVERTSGGIFSSSSTKVLSEESIQLQRVFDETIASYNFLLESLFDINEDISINAGKYSGNTLTERVIPQAVIDSWTQVAVTQQDLDLLDKEIAERTDLMERDAYDRSTGLVGQYDEEIDRYTESIESLADKFNVSIVGGIDAWGRIGYEIDTTAIDAERDRADEILNSWTASAEALEEDFYTYFSDMMTGLDNTMESIFAQLNKDDAVALAEHNLERTNDALMATLENDMFDGVGEVTLQNFDDLKADLIDSGATAEEVAEFTRLGDILVQSAIDADALAEALQAEADAKKAFNDASYTAREDFGYWSDSFESTDIEQALLDKERADRLYTDAMISSGNDVGSIANDLIEVQQLLAEATTDAELESAQEIADLYIDRVETERNYADALSESEQAMNELLSSFNEIPADFEKFNATIDMTELEKVQYDIDASVADLGLFGVAYEDFGSILESVGKDVENGLVSEEDISKWSDLNSLLQSEYEIKREIAEAEKERINNNISSFSDIKTDYIDFSDTSDEAVKLQNEVDSLSKELGLSSVTFDNFGDMLSSIEDDVNNGIVTDEDLTKWSDLNSLLQEQYDLQLQIEEDRLDALQEERDAIIQMGEDISSSMESILTNEINRIQADYDNRVSTISSLESSRDAYAPETAVSSFDIYSAIDNWTLDANDSIASSISAWNSQQLDLAQKLDDEARASYDAEIERLQDIENARVDAYNASIDAKNEEIRLSNELADTISNLKVDVGNTFSDLYSTSVQQQEANLYTAIENKDYDSISSAFSSFATSTQDSNISDTDAFLKIAYANQAVQDLTEPKKQTELQHIEANTIEIADYVSALSDDEKLLNEQTTLMYDELIKQNEGALPNVEDEIAKLFEQNKQYFDPSSDFYSFLERGATDLTFTEKMDEQKILWAEYQLDAINYNEKNLGALEKIDLSFERYADATVDRIDSNESATQALEDKLDMLQKSYDEQIKLNKALLDAQLKANEIAETTADNTKEGVL